MSREKVRLSPDQISDKWNRHMKTAIPDIQAGIDGVTEDPGAKAVEKQEKMLANLTEAVNNGTWAKRRLGVSMNDWKSITKDKVAQRLGTGVDKALPKRKKFDSWLAARLNTVLPEINKMPDMTLEDSFQRVRRMMEHMSAEKYKAQ